MLAERVSTVTAYEQHSVSYDADAGGGLFAIVQSLRYRRVAVTMCIVQRCIADGAARARIGAYVTAIAARTAANP